MITERDLVELAKARAEPALSIYLPVDPVLRQGRENETRLKKVREAARRLAAAHNAADELPASVDDALRRWQQGDSSAEGLAIFAQAGKCRLYELAGAAGDFAVAGERYWIRPLLGAIGPFGHYYVLCLDQESPRLRLASKAGLSEIEQPAAMPNLASIKGKTELPADVGYHPAGSAASGGPPDARYHSQGESPADYLQVELEKYVHGVARAVEETLSGDSAPLVVVAEPNLLGMFRKHAKYPKLMAQAVGKSPSALDDEALQEESWPIVEAELQTPRDEAVQRVCAGHRRGDPEVRLDQGQILEAARQGRLELLLIAESEARATAADADKAGEDAVNAAACETLAYGGRVFVVPDGALPEDAGVAAVLRG